MNPFDLLFSDQSARLSSALDDMPNQSDYGAVADPSALLLYFVRAGDEKRLRDTLAHWLQFR